jgi:amino acid permease
MVGFLIVSAINLFWYLFVSCGALIFIFSTSEATERGLKEAVEEMTGKPFDIVSSLLVVFVSRF